MAEEPQPSNPGPAPTAAEKDREAAALSNLSSQKMTSDDADEAPSTSTQDTAALGAAISNLSIADGTPGKSGTSTASGTGAEAAEKKEVKKVKISDADVTFLVKELEVSKKKAGEMLSGAGGDREVAIRTFVTPVKI